MEPIPSAGLPHYRAIIALDIERSTSRPDSVKAELRNKTYELFDTALHSAGIHKRHRDRYIDRGDGLLALIHPVDQVPKALLLNRAIPALSSLLADYNASLPDPSRLQRQLRVRVVTHAGDVRYDANGCFGEALDVAFRLLDAVPVKRALRETADPLILVISGDIYSSVVRHGYDGIGQHAFHPLVRVHIAGKRYPGWIHIPEANDEAGDPDSPLQAFQLVRTERLIFISLRAAAICRIECRSARSGRPSALLAAGGVVRRRPRLLPARSWGRGRPGRRSATGG